ncbi:SNF2-related protein, partial [Acutalibacter muris]|uniref:SNF2-related protein n=1 Tax=Acutalibacter muris TaxID=1796620 RepID=UPI00272ECD98
AVYGGNTLFAHCMGAGKTFAITASAMEMKRLGLCSKSMIVVPNHLTQQWASEFLRLYPNANILVTTKRDFEKDRRKKFCSRIATGDYDAVIIGYSQFEKIPVSKERQIRQLNQQMDVIIDGIARAKEEDGQRFTVKSLERTKRSLELRLKKPQADSRKDTVIDFEELGIDRLFVDESDNFKNLFMVTKMQNVAGLSTSDARKSSDMFSKTQYLDEITDYKGVIFATGMPISNSITEMFTVQRYLQYNALQAMNMEHFDSWASRFGETVTTMELAPEGTGYRPQTRFAKFFNLPELMNIFHEVADIKTEDMLNLPTPDVEFHNIVAKPTEFQKAYVQELSERATAVRVGDVEPTEDNLLKITNYGRKLGLDQRLISPLAEDDPASKLNLCVKNIMQFWVEGKEDKLTQLVFSDLSTPKKDGSFNVYDDIKRKLMERGVPETEVAFIHDAKTEVKKEELFAKVRSGKVRVLIGSTQKLGAGTNVEDRLIALHHLDCPWRPRDVGRILRTFKIKKNVEVTDNGKDDFCQAGQVFSGGAAIGAQQNSDEGGVEQLSA